jgi:hypothetical protein
MKVRILVGRSGTDFSWHQGEVLDLPQDVAEKFIRLGEHEPVKDEPKQRKVTVQRVRKTTKRPVK